NLGGRGYLGFVGGQTQAALGGGQNYGNGFGGGGNYAPRYRANWSEYVQNKKPGYQFQANLQKPNVESAKRNEVDRLSRAGSVSSAAHAAQLGGVFKYAIDQPVSLPRQKSALLPIVHKEVQGARASIFNESVHEKFPLLGLRFKNTSELNLMQGPVTVFDGNSYAGDARMPDLQPGEERLLSYAIDLGVEVKKRNKPSIAVLTAARFEKGVLVTMTKHREEWEYRAVNRSKSERTLLVEHAVREQFKLVTPTKPIERSRDLYRFTMKLNAGQSAMLTV